MDNNLSSINYYYSGELIRQSELDYQLELHGEPGFEYVIGCDFGLITTNITITKIVPEGIKIVRNMTIQGMTISEQSLLVKQLWKDYNKVVAIAMDQDKVGYVIADSLSLPDIDPRDGEVLPPLINININKENYELIRNGIKVIKFVRFYERDNILIMAIKMKKALEDGLLHFPKIIAWIKNDDDGFTRNNNGEEILQLKQEICDIKVKLDDNGTALNFKRDEDKINKVSRFTSALLSINGALDYIK
jgi:uncharacterized protein YifN (PemK superfamily)